MKDASAADAAFVVEDARSAQDGLAGERAPDASFVADASEAADAEEPDPLAAPPAELLDCAQQARSVERVYPTTISETVELINALPKPTTLPCLLASLPRPLFLVATSNATSAQPALGRENPRIFLITPALTLSVALSGGGRTLLELGEYVAADRSLKAEIELPIEQALEPSEPFLRVKLSDEYTTCGFCHREESPHETIPDAFVSIAFRTFPEMEVPIAEVQQQHELCDADDDSYRCNMLRGLFAFGEVRQGAFPEELALFR